MKTSKSTSRLPQCCALSLLLAACGSCSRPQHNPVEPAAPPADLRHGNAPQVPAEEAPADKALAPPDIPSEATAAADPSAGPDLGRRGRSGSFDAGELPPTLGIRWPQAPRIVRELEVATIDQFERGSQRAGTRLVVVRPLHGAVLIKGSDIEVTMREGVEIDRLRIDHGQKRIRLQGGRYGEIFLSHPAQFHPVKAPRPDWIIEDVIIEGVEMRSPGSAIEAYGHRIAVLDSDIHAQRYSFWSGPVLGIGSQDIFIARNRMSSAGPESTLRLVDVVRSVTVDNVLRNNIKHNYRVHGRSDLAYAARNVFINTGVMFGTMPGDDIGEMWFEDNTFFHRQNDLFHPGQVTRLHAAGNKAHTANFRCFCCEQTRASWRLDKNELLPYREPPPF